VVIAPNEQLTEDTPSVVNVNVAVEVEMVEPSAGPPVKIIHGGVVVPDPLEVLVAVEPVLFVLEAVLPELVEVLVLPLPVELATDISV
jgi:hypothetical protein